jgi:hypothetical protein
MFSVHCKREVDTLRVFKQGDGYDKRSIPVFSCTVHYISDDEIYICNAVGSFSFEIKKAILDHFLEIQKISYERRGKKCHILRKIS